MIKKVFAIVLLLTALCACEETPEEIIIPVASVTISQPEAEMQPGETLQLKAQISPSNATEQNVMWASSKQSVATVSDAGLVTAVAAGTANITATVDGKSATCKITVIKPEVPVVHVESVTLDKADAQLEIGGTLKLTATVLPENADDKSVEWKSSNPAIAEVDQNGNVTAVSEGSASITATAGGKNASCQVTVVKPVVPVVHVESVSLDKTDAKLLIGATMSLIATVLPENADDKSVIWASTNPEIARVDQNGIVTAVSVGTVTITVTTVDGEKMAACEVNVTTDYTALESIILSHTEIAMIRDEQIEITATLVPADASNQSLGWDSSDNDVVYASPRDHGRYALVTARGTGTATITVYGADDVIATCIVTVTTPVESVIFDYSAISMNTGETRFLPVSINPRDADDQTIIWESSAPDVVKVEDGTLRALAVGTATITATVGGKSTTCEVTVKDDIVPITGVTLSYTEYTLTVGEDFVLKALPQPENTNQREFGWITSDDRVAYPNRISSESSESVKVLAMGPGTATISAIGYGGVSATCAITVLEPVVHVESVTLNKSSLNLTVNGVEQLAATVLPENADDKSVTWASTNPAIAEVDQNGRVTALSPGTVTITATTTDGGKVAGCEVTVSEVYVPVESVTIIAAYDFISRGMTREIEVVVLPENASNKTITWSSDNPDVVTVNQQGIATAVAAGTATITAEAGGHSSSCLFTVYVEAESITLDQTDVSMTIGQTIKLNPTVYPPDATHNIYWESTGSAVSVSSDGTVTALAEGVSEVTARIDQVSATCTVTVSGSGYIPVESVVFSYDHDIMSVGDAKTLPLTVLPLNATNRTVNWSSSNVSVAAVDNTGRVTAVGAGFATIYAEVDGKRAEFHLEVRATIKNITFEPAEVNLNIGETAYVIVRLDPEVQIDSHELNNWDPSVFSVQAVNLNDPITIMVTALSEGSGVFEFSTGNKSAECRVTVTKPIVPVASISLDKVDELLRRGNSLDLTATVLPANATDPKVTWSSDNPGVAKVDANGHVTAVGVGLTCIRASAGNESAACIITVIAVPERIDLNATELTLPVGSKYTLVGTVYPDDANDKNVYYYSSNSGIAYVKERTGEIQAGSIGTAVITAKNPAYDITATCTVTVIRAGDPAIMLEQNSFIVDAEASSDDVRIPLQIVNPDSSQLQAAVTSGSDWLHTRVVGGSVSFYYGANNSTLRRTGTITITYSTATATVTVTQKGKAPSGQTDIELNVDPDANNVVSANGEESCGVYAFVINPIEGVQMELSTDVDWMTNLRAGENNWYGFTASKNTSGQTRTGHFILTYGPVTKSIKFVQEPADVSIGITPNDMVFNYEAQVVSFNVVLPEGFNYGNLTFEPDDYWMTDISLRGSTVSFRIKENNSASNASRTGQIKVSYGSHSEYFRFTQTFDMPVVTINPTNLTVNYAYQVHIIDVNIVNERSDYTISTETDHVQPWAYGSGVNENGDLRVTTLENTTGAPRSTVLKVKYGPWFSFNLNITQTASATTITVPESYACGYEATSYTTSVIITDPLQFTFVEVSTEAPWITINNHSVSNTQADVTLNIGRNASRQSRTASVVFTYGDITKIMVVTQRGDTSLPEGFVEMGLPSGTLWAEKNLGAVNDYGIGNYYAWAEKTPKTSFWWNNYKWGEPEALTKYNETDGKKSIDPEDDAATQVNSAWSIPTLAQWEELVTECLSEWVTTPVPGVRFTSRTTGGSIFLPAAEFDGFPSGVECYYWSKTLSDDPSCDSARMFLSDQEMIWSITTGERYIGMFIRPVRQR